RHIDQDRRGRAAVLGPVIDTRKHYQAGKRIKPERDWQKDSKGWNRTDTRQNADQRAQKDADEAKDEDLQRRCRRKPREKVFKHFHKRLLPPERHGLAEPVDKDEDHKGGYDERKDQRLENVDLVVTRIGRNGHHEDGGEHYTDLTDEKSEHRQCNGKHQD